MRGAPSQRFEDRRWLAEVVKPDGRTAGAAFLVDERHLVTCAHVVRLTGCLGVGGTVSVRFPHLGDVLHDATVLPDGWAPENGTRGDSAVLQLAEPVPGTAALPLRARKPTHGTAFDVYGFPEGAAHEFAAAGTVGRPVGHDWVQLESNSAVVPEPGYSGGAVWCAEFGGAIGMVVTRDLPTQGRLAFMVPISALAARSRVVTQALPTPLDLDPARDTHWLPRARGVQTGAQTGWWFTGRRRALEELTAWLSRDGSAQSNVRVVTGAPGVGKSAVLARIAVLADRRLRLTVPGLDDDDAATPPLGSVSLTMHARDRDVEELAQRAADLFELDCDASTLPQALGSHDPPVTLLVDAVDEAFDPQRWCRTLNEIAQWGTRVLVGCKPHLAERLDDPTPIQLDVDPYWDPEDIPRYLRQWLAADGLLQQEELAGEIAKAAAGNFLVAQLCVRAVQGGRGAPAAGFPRTVRGAFDTYLDALEDDSARVRDVLLPLAYSFGDGLPADELWLAGVAALRRPITLADLEEVLQGPAGSFLTISTTNQDGERRYRLFHQALVDALQAPRNPTDDHRRLFDRWIEDSAGPTGHRWKGSPRYLHDHMSDHAAAGGRLPELLHDHAYFLEADLHRLRTHVAHHAEAAPSYAELLELAASKANPLSPERRASLLILAARHLGLGDLAVSLRNILRPSWTTVWAHSLGSPHTLLTSQANRIGCLAVITVDGAPLIVSGGTDGTIRQWNPTTGQPIGEPLLGHTSRVRVLAVINIDGAPRIVSGSADHTIRQWDPATGQPIGQPLTGHSRAVNALAVLNIDGAPRIVSGSNDHTIRQWNPATGQPIGEPWRGRSSVRALAIAAVDKAPRIVSGSTDGTLRQWNPATGQPIGQPLTGHTSQIKTLTVIDIDGATRIVSGSTDGTIRQWNPATGQPIRQPLTGHTSQIRALAVIDIDNATRIITAGTDGTIRQWNLTSRQLIGQPLTGHTNWVRALAVINVNGAPRILSGGTDGTIRQWDPATGQPIGEPLTGHTSAVNALAVIDIDGAPRIVSGSADHTIRQWDPATGQPISQPLTGHTSQAKSLAIISVDGASRIVSGSSDRTIRQWDPVTGQPIGQPLTGHTSQIKTLAVIDIDGAPRIVSGSADSTIRQWNPATGQPIGQPLTGHTSWVTAAAVITVDGAPCLITSSSDRTIRRWDPATGRMIGVLDAFARMGALTAGPEQDVYLASGSSICRVDVPTY